MSDQFFLLGLRTCHCFELYCESTQTSNTCKRTSKIKFKEVQLIVSKVGWVVVAFSLPLEHLLATDVPQLEVQTGTFFGEGLH